VPGTEGAAGMAAIVSEGALDLAELRKHLARFLPPYARPLFLRITDHIEATATFKHTKNDLKREGYDPAATSDPIFFDDPARGAFVPLDRALYQHIQDGKVRL
jgi:fatty-acyl-CoA synthase